MKCKNCGRTIEANSVYCNWCGKYQLKKPKQKVTVPKPWRLPSGKWRVQKRSMGIDVVDDTPEKAIKKAKIAIDLWLTQEALGLHDQKPVIVTLGKVVDDYISAKSAVLSPSTISSYQSMRDNYFLLHWDDDVNTLNPQEIINDEIGLERKPKTIRNGWALCSSALTYAGISFTSPTLPRAVKNEKAWLDYNQIQTFLKAVEGMPCELGALLALHSLRRSEIFGLRPVDYDAKKLIIHVRGAILFTIQNGWVYSELNKNDTSRRDVPVIIPRLAELLKDINPEQEYIVKASKVELYRQINEVCEFADLPLVGVHGLRHSFASLAYHLNWKKLTTQQIGGWKNSKVLDEIYTHNADLETDLETMREFFRE